LENIYLEDEEGDTKITLKSILGI